MISYFMQCIPRRFLTYR